MEALEASSFNGLEDFDLNVVGHYVERLAELNTQQEVVAEEDIYNDKGVLLVKSGTQIGRRVAEKIVNFKLVKPLHEHLRVADEIDGARLSKNFRELLRKDPVLGDLVSRSGLDLVLQSMCNLYQTFPLLRQKLTVLANRLPKIYQRGLESALLCLLIARHQRLPTDAQETLFIAALLHDIGMLHIDPKVIDQPGKLTEEHWRQVQAHVVIGYRILQSVPGLHKEVPRAVLEHHERCDGTGYPLGKLGDDLSGAGLILAVVDGGVAIYHNRLEPLGQPWQALAPMLQIVGDSYFYQAASALVALLRSVKGDAMTRPVTMDAPELAQGLVHLLQQACGCYQEAQQQFKRLGIEGGQEGARPLRQLFAHIDFAVRGSGLLDTDYRQWLMRLEGSQPQNVVQELFEAQLLAEELTYHLQRLCRLMVSFATNCPSAPADCTLALSARLNALASLSPNGSRGVSERSVIVDRVQVAN